MNPSRSRLAIHKHINYKILSLGLVAALLIPVALLLMVWTIPAVKASPGWWDINWPRRRPILISGNHPGDYQIKIVVPHNGYMRSDYGDLRFLENEAAGVLAYWIENYTTDNATVWVRRAENSDNTIYVYYGNPSATNAGNENAVDPVQLPAQPLLFYLFAVHETEIHAAVIGDAPMHQGFVETLVRIGQFHVFPHNGDADIVSRILDLADYVLPGL
jgi:hypothetical protein